MTGKEMRKLRRLYDLSQQSFGDLLGYQKNYISFLERNDKPLSKKMLKLLREKMSQLTGK